MNKLYIHSFKNLKIGRNNYISPTAKICDNVEIGDNNMIYDNVIIYPNTKIGNDNVIHNRNIIGEIPVQSNGTFQNNDYSKTKGVNIGNNNFLHVSNLIFAGSERPTEIKNNNKLLAENHIGHDVIVHNNVTIYPRIIAGGFCEILDNANIGGYAFIQQRKIIGQRAMVGGGQLIAKNVFPFIVYLNNKKHRLNKIKLDEQHLKEENNILNIANKFYENSINKELFESEIKNIHNNIRDDLLYFLEKSKFKS